MDLPRTVSGTAFLNVEKMELSAKIFETSLPFGIEFDILETIVERRLSVNFDKNYEDNFTGGFHSSNERSGYQEI